jgi:hypothetical protein
MKKRKLLSLFMIFLAVVMGILVCSVYRSFATQTPLEDKVAVLITSWGMPAGYNFGYAMDRGFQASDKTTPGFPCDIGHVGTMPYQAHLNITPWRTVFKTTGQELFWDSSGLYQYIDGMYVSPIAGIPPVDPLTITALKNVTTMGVYNFPVDPRDGTDWLAGWYKIGSTSTPFINGYSDYIESNPPTFIRYYGFLGVPPGVSDPSNSLHPAIFGQEEIVKEMLEESFGDRVDVRFGYYSPIPGYTKQQREVATEFANEGFTKMLIARETTDNNIYANEFMSGNNVKEALCIAGTLDDTEIYHTRQVGRTPEFNAMNVMVLKPYIEAYPEGSTIGIIYYTRGLPWNSLESGGPTGGAHPWSREIYHENAYLNYLAWKKAVQAAFGDRYHLVFTKNDIESDLRVDNFFAYGVNKDSENKDTSGNTVFYSVRKAIQMAKESGLDKIIYMPCHWDYDNFDNIMLTRLESKMPLPPKANLEAGIYTFTHCEDMAGIVVPCGDARAVATITGAPSYTYVEEQFATAYYVVLRGTLERFGLYPNNENIEIEASQWVTKLNGGTVEVLDEPSHQIKGAKIGIPGDPYPDRPNGFTPATKIAPNNPMDSMDCLWEDTIINIGIHKNAPPMKDVIQAGPAVYFGPYRTIFNRDVTITIPYIEEQAKGGNVNIYIYNHVTDDWEPILVEKAENGLVTFKTQVLGLFRAGIKK